MGIGIVSWGAYIPWYKITVDEIAAVHGDDAAIIKKNLQLVEKSVPAIDEDAITLAVEASRIALNRKQPKSQIGAVFFGSESHPYVVKPTSTIVADAIGLSTNLMSADLEFACKAGTAALQILYSMVKSELIECGLGGATDTAQSKPGEVLEYSAAAGAASFIIGKEDVVAEIKSTCSYSTDTPDFWRRQNARFPSHAGGFTGGPAYFHHVEKSAKMLMEKMNTTPSDYDFIVLHQPNGKFAKRATKSLGFTPKQAEFGMIVGNMGNAYSASSLLGLINTLENSKPGQTILLTSYGSGAGSDSFHIEVKDNIENISNSGKKLSSNFQNKNYLSYAQYLMRQHK